MPRAQRQRTDNLVAMPVNRDVEIGESDIARRAYELYQERGGEPGHELEDWLAAERELREAARSTAA